MSCVLVDKKKNGVISILKGIGIILVVIGHSRCPDVLNNWIFSFHMPLFFIASGYLYKSEYFLQPGEFFLRKVKSLYWPFVKWSLIFLLLHNIFFDLNVINNVYGISTRFSYYDILSNMVDVFTKMTSYDNAICGAFWFFRSLFVGLLFFTLGTWLINKFFNTKTSVLLVTLIFGLAGGIKTILGKDIPNWPQGGYREIMAVYFIGFGYLIKIYFSKYLTDWRIAFAGLAILCISAFSMPTNMSYQNQTMQKWMTICITGVVGFFFIYFISILINRRSGIIKKVLAFYGDNSIYVIIFHFLFFKPVSYLKTIIWGWDWRMVGCHPVISEHNEWFWIIYSVSSLLLCAGVIKLHYVLAKYKARLFPMF